MKNWWTLAAGALLAAVVVSSMPEIKRYLRIRAM